MKRNRYQILTYALILVLAVVVVSLAACESPVSVSNEATNTIGGPPIECDPATTEEINGECVALTCDEGLELDDEGECVEGEPDA